MDTRDICSICLEEISDDAVYALPCSHVYHADCIVQCFRRGDPRCPVCRDGEQILEAQEQQNMNDLREMLQEDPNIALLNLAEVAFTMNEEDAENAEDHGAARAWRAAAVRRNRRARSSPVTLEARDRFWRARDALVEAERRRDQLYRDAERADRGLARLVRDLEKEQRRFHRVADRDRGARS